MVVGHNPTMEQLVYPFNRTYQTDADSRYSPTSNFPIERWETLDLYTKGTLVNLWTPKTLFTD